MTESRSAKGIIEYQEFYAKDSKPIIDEIDRVFAKSVRKQ
jgi:hypothetical protein